MIRHRSLHRWPGCHRDTYMRTIYTSCTAVHACYAANVRCVSHCGRSAKHMRHAPPPFCINPKTHVRVRHPVHLRGSAAWRPCHEPQVSCKPGQGAVWEAPIATTSSACAWKAHRADYSRVRRECGFAPSLAQQVVREGKRTGYIIVHHIGQLPCESSSQQC